MKVYHGTTLENAIRIMDEGFKIQQNEVTNDLGAGLYTYCDDELGIWKPQKNALRNARQYKNGKHCVIELTIDDDLVKDGYLDLDDPEMTIQWEKLEIYCNLVQTVSGKLLRTARPKRDIIQMALFQRQL